jgi:hypothetical protein
MEPGTIFLAGIIVGMAVLDLWRSRVQHHPTKSR